MKLHRLPLLLVNAPYPRRLKFPGQPTSLLYAAADSVVWAEREIGNNAVQLVNYNLLDPCIFAKSGMDHYEKLLSETSPLVVAISTTTASLPIARQLACMAKSAINQPLVVIGGPHEDDAEDSAKTVLWDMNIDLSVSGDGETALRAILEIACLQDTISAGDIIQYLRAWIQDPKNAGDIYGVGRVTARNNSSDCEPLVVTLSTPDGGRSFDQLPYPPRHLLAPEENYHYPIFHEANGSIKPTTQVMTARGCIKRCNFCSESQKLRQRSLANVVKEIEYISNLGYKAIFFDDSTMTNLSQVRRRYIRELGNILYGLGIEWGCQTRVDCVDRELLYDMAERGCTYIYFGIESFSEKLLNALGKGYTPHQIETVLSDCNLLGIRVGASILLGAPDENHRSLETVETARMTFSKIREYADNGPIRVVSLNMYAYYPGTESTNQLAKTYPEIKTAGFYNKFEIDDQYPYNLLEENSPYAPAGLREQMYDILTMADDLLGDLLIGNRQKERAPHGPFNSIKSSNSRHVKLTSR